MKRQIPVFKVHVQSGADYDQLHDIPEVKEVVIEEVVYAIKDALKRKKLNKDQFKPSLEAAIEYFVEKEEYDRCIECRDLMNSIN